MKKLSDLLLVGLYIPNNEKSRVLVMRKKEICTRPKRYFQNLKCMFCKRRVLVNTEFNSSFINIFSQVSGHFPKCDH